LYYDEKCHACAELSKDTLLKIARELKVAEVDDYTSHASLCRKIARHLTFSVSSVENANVYGKKLLNYLNDYSVVDYKMDRIKELVEKHHANLFTLSETGKPGKSIVNNFLMKNQNLQKEIILYLLKQTELYAETFPEYSEDYWEEDIGDLFHRYQYYTEGRHAAVLSALLDFGTWRVLRKLAHIRMVLDKSPEYTKIPRDVKNLIAFRTILTECENKMLDRDYRALINDDKVLNDLKRQYDLLGVTKSKNGVYDHPMVGTLKQTMIDEKFHYLIIAEPTLDIFSLARIFRIAETQGKNWNTYINDVNVIPWSKAKYCLRLKQRLSLA
jgi:hypothetical protein